MFSLSRNLIAAFIPLEFSANHTSPFPPVPSGFSPLRTHCPNCSPCSSFIIELRHANLLPTSLPRISRTVSVLVEIMLLFDAIIRHQLFCVEIILWHAGGGNGFALLDAGSHFVASAC